MTSVPPSGSSSFNMRLEGGPEAAAAARRAVTGLDGGIAEMDLETVRLLVTELVANSVRHAKTKAVGVQAVVTGGSIWLEVTDEGAGFDAESARRSAAQRDDSGWGLLLVDRLSDRWGVGTEDGNTSVWFELKRAA